MDPVTDTDSNFSNFTFRKLENEDYHKGFLELLSQLSSSPFDIDYDMFCGRFHMMINHERIAILVVEDETTNKIVATGKAIYESKFRSGAFMCVHIEDIVVDEKYRGRGLGRLVVEKLVGDALQFYAVYKIILNCDQEKVEFYEKCGMTVAGIQMEIRKS